MRRDPLVLRLCLGILHLVSALVPRLSRADWRAEWEAEIRHRWQSLDARRHLDWRAKMDLVSRAMGALPDAAWLRRQFTLDAEIVHDARYGARMLGAFPGFTLAAVLILALGIGGAVSVASLLDTLIFRPLPYAGADRIVTVWQRHAARGVREDVAPANFLDWRERASAFESLAAAIPYSYDFTGGGEPEVFFGAQVTEGFWDAIGMAPALGRAFLPHEHVLGGPRVVIISHGLWMRKFGGDPAIVNKAISLEGEPFTVVGILPRAFAPQLLPRPGELGVWTPKVVQEHEHRTRGSAWWNVVGRLNPGTTLEQAQHEMDAIARDVAREHPRTNENLGVAVVPLREHLMGDLRPALFVMLAAVVLVLGIACANVAGLLLARGAQREREFAIRAALGAARGRLVRQLVAESLLLSSWATLAGIALAHWAIRTIVALAPGRVLRLQDAAIDARMLVFAAAVGGLTALAFGLVPALQFARSSQDALRERQPAGPRRWFRRSLVAAEIALALILLTGAGLLIRSFGRLLAVDPGFSPANVVALQVFAWDRNGTPARTRAFFDTTLERIRETPGVQAAGAVSAMPFMIASIDAKSPLHVIGRDAVGAGERAGVYLTIATPGYFEAMRIPLREGRFITPQDTERSAPVAVISEALRRREWPGESPIGRRIRLQWQGQAGDVEIVGVAGEVRHDGLDGTPRPEVFLPLRQRPFASMTYVVRGAGDPSALIAAVKREVWALDPRQTFYDVATVPGLIDASVVRQRFSMTLMSAFALLALALCASGVYGLISFTTAQRTREIGVRIALGASGASIRRLVLWDGCVLIAAGLAVGAAGARLVSRVLQTLLFQVQPGDPVTFAAACALLGLVGLAACYLPARRAMRVEPIVALRAD